jgi:hypothetical protein
MKNIIWTEWFWWSVLAIISFTIVVARIIYKAKGWQAFKGKKWLESNKAKIDTTTDFLLFATVSSSAVLVMLFCRFDKGTFFIGVSGWIFVMAFLAGQLTYFRQNINSSKRLLLLLISLLPALISFAGLMFESTRDFAKFSLKLYPFIILLPNGPVIIFGKSIDDSIDLIGTKCRTIFNRSKSS